MAYHLNATVRSVFLISFIYLGSCASSEHSFTASPLKLRIANPASAHCAKAGGQLMIEKRPDGAEYGVCLFEDNRQCEEWALYREKCPTGGIRITGYWTDAARYCAITGGVYKFSSAGTSAIGEQGTCALSGVGICDVHAYYSGKCP